jgi:hypothetical protein
MKKVSCIRQGIYKGISYMGLAYAFQQLHAPAFAACLLTNNAMRTMASHRFRHTQYCRQMFLPSGPGGFSHRGYCAISIETVKARTSTGGDGFTLPPLLLTNTLCLNPTFHTWHPRFDLLSFSTTGIKPYYLRVCCKEDSSRYLRCLLC